MMLNREEFDEALAVLCSDGLARMDPALLLRVALTVWYTSLIPDLGKVPAADRADIGYLLDRLSRFNIMSKQRKLDLLGSLAPYKPISPPATMSACKDVLAIEWGASADMMPFVEELLPYQTRHYAATI